MAIACCSLWVHPLLAYPAETSHGKQPSSSGAQREFCRCAVVPTSNSRFANSAGASVRCGRSVGTKELLGTSFSLRLLEAGVMPGRLPGLKVEAAKRVQTGRSYVLSSTLTVAEGNEESAAALCKEILKWGEEKKGQEGSGLRTFECSVDLYEKNVYHFWERYDSFQFMNDLRSSPEHTKFMNDVRPLLVGPIALAAYEYKDGKIGHMMNPIGPKGEGGLDDATGQAGTKQQSSSIGQGLGSMEEDEGSKAWGLDKMLTKIRAEVKEGGWIKTLFGDTEKKPSK